MTIQFRTRMFTGLLACLALLPWRGDASDDASIELRSWDGGGEYRPPDFNRFFPDSIAGAEALVNWWEGAKREDESAAEVLSMLRQGLRHYDGDRAALLRWVGRRFIDPPRLQEPMAIEIMYHAADDQAPADLRGPAIRFGLTAVRPMSSSILRALAALSMASDDPDELDRIARGIDGQRDEALGALTVYLESDDASVREKAAVLRQLWALELKAHDWAQARNREQTEAAFGDQLPAIRNSLRSGSSSERRTTLEFVAQHDILLIAPDNALAWLAQCATDPDAEVRAQAARMIGEGWILHASDQDPVAVELLLKLSDDDSGSVRHNAVFYGLAVVSPKRDAVLLRLLEVAAGEPSGDLSERIAWGLRAYRPRVRVLLEGWIASEEGARSAAGRRLYGALLE